MASVLGLLHGIDFLFTGLLTGAIVYFRAIQPDGGPSERRLLSRLVVLVFLSALAWMLCAAADMGDTWNPRSLWDIAANTGFGLYWRLELGAILALLLLLQLRGLPGLAWLGLAVPLFSSLTSHAGAATTGRALALGLDYAHFLAVGVWTGGLFALGAALRARLREPAASPSPSFDLVRRFSRAAAGATAVLAVTGILMASRYGVEWRAPWATDYGKHVLVKVFFFCLALAGASANRFVHLRSWSADGDRRFAASVEKTIRFELAAIVLTFLAAGFLTGLPLPGR